MTARRTLYGSVRKQSSGRWQARYVVPKRFRTNEESNRQRSLGAFDTEREAKAALTSITAAINEGRWEDPDLAADPAPTPTLNNLAAAWFARRRLDALEPDTPLREHTVTEQQRIWDTYIAKPLGSVEVAKLTSTQAQAWFDELRRGRSLSTVKKPLSLLTRIVEDAQRAKLVSENVAQLVVKPRQTSKAKMSCLSAADVEAVAAELTTVTAAWSAKHVLLPGRSEAHPAFDPALMVLLTVFGGAMRSGELRALLVSDFDPATRRLSITKAISGGVVGEPKTAAGVRTVTLDETTAEQVTAHIDGRRGDDLMFRSPEGRRVDGNSLLLYWFRPALRRAGLDEKTRWHDLRHTGISLALAAGVPVTDVSVWAGHGNPSITLSTYSHAIAGRESVVADALADAFGRSVPTLRAAS